MKIVILGHENPDVDSLLSGILLEKYMKDTYKQNFEFIIPDGNVDEESKQILKSIGIDISSYCHKKVNPNDKLLLVDHNVENRFNNEIIGIIDHHPTIEQEEKKENYCININQNSCSTTAIIGEMFDIKDKNDFTLALVGALVDTASFHSTKTNQEQAQWLKQRCIDLGIDFEKYYDIGLCLTDMKNLNEVYLNGLKKYSIEGNKVESSSIQIKDITKYASTINQLIDYIENYRVTKNLDYFVFIVHDMDQFKTTTYTISNEGVTIKNYDKYTSRGNVIIPELKDFIIQKKTKRNPIL